MEANGASSKKISKIKLYKKEAQDTKHWLRMIAIAVPQKKIRIQN